MDDRGRLGRSVRRLEQPGGTPGGLGSFVLGMGLAAVGGYLIANQVIVSSGYWLWWGPNTFGLTLVPLLLGIGFLFFNGRSPVGWLLAGVGVLIIFAGILTNLQIHFRPTSLFNTILMLALFVSGLGLMARGLFAR